MAKKYSTSVLTVYDENGNSIPVPAIQGKSAYAYAIEGGYMKSEAEFRRALAKIPETISLGIASDGLIYIFVNGETVGTGIPQGTSVEQGDLFGYIDENNTVVLKGELADGTYNIKYEMEDGEIVNIGNLVLDTNVYYSVSSNLTYCTINNNTKTIAKGESYSATITADSGYELKSVSVTMGGQPVSVSGGNINIANVTGNIVITAVAETAIINQLPISTNADGSLYVGTNGEKGYKTGYRISTSGGGESTCATACVTGFIPISAYDTLCIEGITLHATAGYNGLVLYDENHNFLIGTNLSDYQGVTLNNGVYSVVIRTLNKSDQCAFIRFSCGTITENTVVTVKKANA